MFQPSKNSMNKYQWKQNAKRLYLWFGMKNSSENEDFNSIPMCFYKLRAI